MKISGHRLPRICGKWKVNSPRYAGADGVLSWHSASLSTPGPGFFVELLCLTDVCGARIVGLNPEHRFRG